MKKLIFILCTISLVAACTSSKKLNSEPATFEVGFGNYGGFTGSSTVYLISGNGQVFIVENINRQPHQTISKKKIEKLKEHLNSIGFENLKVNEPGNLTYFIKVKTGNSENTVKWNDETKNTDLKETYKMLFEIIK